MHTSDEKSAILDAVRDHVAPHRVETWEAFGTQLVIGLREGYRMWDLSGRELIDLHLNGGTFNLGHRNPQILEALADALADLDIGNHHFASRARARFAESLVASAPGDLPYVVFCTSGAEANDVAIKSARHATGRRRIVGLDTGFHGRSGLAAAAGAAGNAEFFLSDLPADFATVPYADLDRLSSELAHGDVAGVILETVPATSGFPSPPPGYLADVAALCRQHGACYIADEVQAGLGRSGELWAVERFAVEPDILVTGKGLSGGIYPVAATLLSPAAGAWLAVNGWGHSSTFGGSEIGCVVGERVLEMTLSRAVSSRVAALIERLETDLATLQEREPFLAEVRQTGLLIGLRVAHPDGAIFLQQELFELGVWAIASGFDQSVLQFKPGLLLDDDTLDAVLERLERALARAKTVDRPVPRRHPAPSRPRP